MKINIYLVDRSLSLIVSKGNNEKLWAVYILGSGPLSGDPTEEVPYYTHQGIAFFTCPDEAQHAAQAFTAQGEA
tara:strand:- start:277 stop:498 length:222 start_codon:yes stop_codon:yes gene_type:complete